MLFLITIFTILFAFIAYKRIDWAIMLMLFALPSYLIRFKAWEIPSTLLEVMILVLFLVWVWKDLPRLKAGLTRVFKRTAKMVKIPYPFQWEIILLLAISLISAGVAGFSNAAFGIWKAYFLEPILVYIVVVNVFAYRDKPLGTPDAKLAWHSGCQAAALLWPLLVSALFISLLAIYQKITGHLIDNPFWAAEVQRRVVSVFGYPNAVGLYLAPLVMVLGGWALDKIRITRSTSLGQANYELRIKKNETSSDVIPVKTGIQNPAQKSWIPAFARMTQKWLPAFIILTIILSLLAILFAKSMGAALGLAAGAFVFALLAGKRSRITAIILVVIAATVIFAIPQTRTKAIERLTLQDFSGQVRLILWDETWKMLQDGRSVFGAGLASYQETVKPYHVDGFYYNKDKDPDFHRKTLIFDDAYRAKYWQPLEVYLYPHNIFLNFWSELGLAGMLLFIWIIGRFLFIGVRQITNPPAGRAGYKLHITDNKKTSNEYLLIGLISAMVCMAVHGLVDVPYFKNDLAVTFWVLLAMMSIIKLDQNRNYATVIPTKAGIQEEQS